MLQSRLCRGIGFSCRSRRSAQVVLPVARSSFSRRNRVLAQASWGAPVDFSAAKVVSNKTVFPGMHRIVLDVGVKVKDSYGKPGQFLQVRMTLHDASMKNASNLHASMKNAPPHAGQGVGG